MINQKVKVHPLLVRLFLSVGVVSHAHPWVHSVWHVAVASIEFSTFKASRSVAAAIRVEHWIWTWSCINEFHHTEQENCKDEKSQGSHLLEFVEFHGRRIFLYNFLSIANANSQSTVFNPS
uniref:Putative secreted protein n=1 Tax=Lutzomyia longipalpis TaxID=7200 RepID=A0A7G3AH12_LUTLO